MIAYGMKKDEIYSKLIGNSIPTYYKWLKQRKENNGVNNNRLIIKLLNDYFTEEELIEFLETHQIEKYKHYNYLLDIEKLVLQPKAKKLLIDEKNLSYSLDVLHLLKALKNRYETIIREHIKEGKPRLDGKYEEIANFHVDEYGAISEGYGYKEFNFYIQDVIFNSPSIISELLEKELTAYALYYIQHALVTIGEKHLEEIILHDYEGILNDIEMKIKYEEKILQDRESERIQMLSEDFYDDDNEEGKIAF